MSGGLIYDAGALVAAERGSAAMWRIHKKSLERGVEPLVYSPVLAQVWRGGNGKQALLARFLTGCRLEGFSVAAAYDVGRLLAVSGTGDIVDAAVVLNAIWRQDAVVTSDPGDLRYLADAVGIAMPIEVV